MLWAARRYGGLTLREARAQAGDTDYSAVALAVRRVKERAGHDRALRRAMRTVERECAMRRCVSNAASVAALARAWVFELQRLDLDSRNDHRLPTAATSESSFRGRAR